MGPDRAALVAVVVVVVVVVVAAVAVAVATAVQQVVQQAVDAVAEAMAAAMADATAVVVAVVVLAAAAAVAAADARRVAAVGALRPLLQRDAHAVAPVLHCLSTPCARAEERASGAGRVPLEGRTSSFSGNGGPGPPAKVALSGSSWARRPTPCRSKIAPGPAPQRCS